MWEVCTAPAKNGREMCYCLCLQEHNCIKEEPYMQIKKTKGEVKSAYNKKIIVLFRERKQNWSFGRRYIQQINC